MLTLEALEYRQGDFTLAADWALAPGTICAVIGPSGSGKSTLLAMIGGYLAPTAGRILWEGRDITALAPGTRPVAALFQDNNLFAHMTAAQNVALALTLAARPDADTRARVAAALEHVGLSGLDGRKPAALSGGQQSRVALARVMLQDRPVILLDEPFAALGPALKAEMLDLVARIVRERGATVLMVSHDPGDARRIAECAVLVAEGRAAAPVPVARLLDTPPEALRAYLGEG